MSRVRSIVRWVFLRGPAAFYELADSSPGLVSVLVLVAWLPPVVWALESVR